MTMPDVDLDAIEQRLDRATPGPWEAGETHHYHEGTYHERYTEVEPNIAAGLTPADADLIAHAPTDLAALVAEVRALRAVADAARDLIDCDPDTAKLDYLIELEDAVNAWRAGGGE